jgi:hypothetical protein
MHRLNFLCLLCIVQIKLSYPDEYLDQIEGSYDETPWKYDNGQPIIGITSITFKSNFKAYGPYGKPGKDTFKSESGEVLVYVLIALGYTRLTLLDSTLSGNVY